MLLFAVAGPSLSLQQGNGTEVPRVTLSRRVAVHTEQLRTHTQWLQAITCLSLTAHLKGYRCIHIRRHDGRSTGLWATSDTLLTTALLSTLGWQ
jgi:hypothetical protein